MRLENFAGNYYDTNSDFDIRLDGGGLVLFYDANFLPNGSWNHYQIPFVASSGWRKNVFFPSTVAATEEELQQALANITSLQIRGNYTDLPTTTHLDSVGYYSVPEPTLISIAPFAALVACSIRRRREFCGGL
jgi:hypothetical protein